MMRNNSRMYIRRTWGEMWGAQAMTAILNASPFASVTHVVWGHREDRGLKEFALFIWVDAPPGVDVPTFCNAQIDICDAALAAIPNFTTSGMFPNK